MEVGQEPGVHVTDAAHFMESGLREKVIEHLFVGDLLRCLWRQGARDIDVLRAEVDRAGYDIVIECNGVLRHVQLKSSHRLARTREVGININLGRKPSGCVIWIWFDPDTLDLGPFLWFGGHPSEPLPSLGDRVGRHSKADATGHKAARPNIRVIRKTEFSKLSAIEDVALALFGGVPENPAGESASTRSQTRRPMASD